jgi:predicted short-subunit dehydrogenase-like oxidoreductase (DUF2520 family)
MKIAVIGSGNLATQVATALYEQQHHIVQVYSPTLAHAQELAARLNCDATADYRSVTTDADAYIIAVKDDAIKEVAQAICPKNPSAVFMHTAGSVSIDVFKGHAQHYGVLYPMQSFSKARRPLFREIPFFIEASDAESLNVIRALAESVSENVIEADSDRRKKMHLAAVFCSNMANHCYRLAERTLQAEGIDFNLFLPLIEETANKVRLMSPKDAQTGPMRRGDTQVMQMQEALIPDERTRQIYRLFADSIRSDYE